MTGILTTPTASEMDLELIASSFCAAMPHRGEPFCKRNWGGPLHSLCSYQGKLKPAIAHFLISQFTQPGDVVLDPMGGVGTIALEARRQGRIGISNDLSPLADAIARPKLESCSSSEALDVAEMLKRRLVDGPGINELLGRCDVTFGLNGPISSYFNADTLREVLIAREFFRDGSFASPVARDVVRSAVLHILHGNRPYVISRNSHPVTPFAPTGPDEYRSLAARLDQRLTKVLPALQELNELSQDGLAVHRDFRDLICVDPVDAVITSPPFAQSLRFWSSNWMRLWFVGWERQDFSRQPELFVEFQQQRSYDVYSDFARATRKQIKPGGTLILHLGETASENMVEHIRPHLDGYYEVVFVGRENVADTESHGIRDKGATHAHWYLFASAV
jgi:hypothetical protein